MLMNQVIKMTKIKNHRIEVCALLICMLFCSSCKHEKKNVIEVNETIVCKEPDTHQEVRHIVLRGTNQEIGKALEEQIATFRQTRTEVCSAPRGAFSSPCSRR